MNGLLTLQANQRGAWKNVLTFDARREPEVLEAATRLARAADMPQMRITDGDHVRWAMTGAFQWGRDPFKRREDA